MHSPPATDHAMAFRRLPAPASAVLPRLARREREVAEAVRAMGEASATEVETALSDRLSNSAIRSMLVRLQGKGVLHRRKVGKRYVYGLVIADQPAREQALQRICREHFGGSFVDMAAAALDLARSPRPSGDA